MEIIGKVVRLGNLTEGTSARGGLSNLLDEPNRRNTEIRSGTDYQSAN